LSLWTENSEMKGQLVVEIIENKKSIAWRSSDTQKWIDSSSDQRQTIYYSVQMHEALKPY
jgi:hypothetical protein